MGALIGATILTVLQVWYLQRKRKGSNAGLVGALLVGLLLGTALDYVLGYQMGLWAYQRHPYWELSYWLVLPAMWAEFGAGTYVLWHMLKPRWLTVPILLALYEGYGLIRDSWQYTVSWWLVIPGWFVLIGTIIGLVNLIEYSRAKVAHVDRRGNSRVLAAE